MAQEFMKSKIESLKASAQNSNLSKRKPTSPMMYSGDNESDSLVSGLQAKVKLLEGDVKRRQESYVARERKDREKIILLERELESVQSGKREIIGGDTRMKIVKEMHGQIMKNVTNVQATTARILQEQERDLLRAFRARLFDVQNELEKEKSKSEEGASLWIEKNRQLEKDLEWAKEMADRLERVNQQLTRDNATLKQQFKTQEDDREFLIKELVAVRKDNERLRQERDRLVSENDTLKKESADKERAQPQFNVPQPAVDTATISTGNGNEKSGYGDAKYKNIINKMKSLLEKERKNLRLARSKYEKEVQERSQLEIFLRECVADVRSEIHQRRTEMVEKSRGHSRPGSSNSTRDVTRPGSRESVRSLPEAQPIHEFSAADRERVMELLLSQERVISLLYAKTFPLPGQIANAPTGNKPGTVNLPRV
eukprot:Stramenopile-MAST_4_protein_1089